MAVFGAIGLGLVWGWVAARLAYRARWDVVARVALGTAALGLTAQRLAAAQALAAGGVAAVVGGLLCLAWLRSLERRFARMR